MSANFKPKRTAAASRGFLAKARFSGWFTYYLINILCIFVNIPYFYTTALFWLCRWVYFILPHNVCTKSTAHSKLCLNEMIHHLLHTCREAWIFRSCYTQQHRQPWEHTLKKKLPINNVNDWRIIFIAKHSLEATWNGLTICHRWKMAKPDEDLHFAKNAVCAAYSKTSLHKPSTKY